MVSISGARADGHESSQKAYGTPALRGAEAKTSGMYQAIGMQHLMASFDTMPK
ncbi:MAG: hypothetical protein ACI8S6_005567 [Myxococcota bacterium]